MCGIVGIAARDRIDARDWLVIGRDRMTHRGPDDAGVWWSDDGRVGLGHRRLAIVDLSPAGHQPMHSEGGELSIVFNGEIYNFGALRQDLAARGQRFHSNSDTEVILAAYRQWDVACLEHLQGMFAFALYDSRKQRLFLARDRAGEKPLFYCAGPSSIRFASELKALMADTTQTRKLDWAAFDRYLADGFVPSDRSILEGVRKLPPAHALIFEAQKKAETKIWRYWRPPPPPTRRVVPPSDSELELELELLLETAVRRQLMADVPVGVLLSGGIDSSIVTAMAARAANCVKTFTVRFPGFGGYDETEHARLVARHFKTDHIEIDAEAADVALLQKLARQFDEPMTDSSMVPTYLVSQVVRRHCTVALGGDGGDELFGGYPHYDRLLRFEPRVNATPRLIRACVGRAAGELLPVGTRGRNWLQGIGADWRTEVPPVTEIFDAVTRRRLLRKCDRWSHCPDEARVGPEYRSLDLMQRASRYDFDTYLPEDLLVKVDRASMLNSLEVRAPLLDVPVIEFAFGRVPSHLKATPTQRKILLKRLAQKILPSSFDGARKQGFSIPLSSWLQSGTWRGYFSDVLLDSGTTWFDRGLVAKWLQNERSGRSNAERLFGLMMFELWRREYRVELAQ